MDPGLTNLSNQKSEMEIVNENLELANQNCKKTLGLIILTQLFLRYKGKNPDSSSMNNSDDDLSYNLEKSFKEISCGSSIPLVAETKVTSNYLSEEAGSSFVSETVFHASNVHRNGEILHITDESTILYPDKNLGIEKTYLTILHLTLRYIYGRVFLLILASNLYSTLRKKLIGVIDNFQNASDKASDGQSIP